MARVTGTGKQLHVVNPHSDANKLFKKVKRCSIRIRCCPTGNTPTIDAGHASVGIQACNNLTS